MKSFISDLKDELTMINNCEEEINNEIALKLNIKICSKIDELYIKFAKEINHEEKRR